MKKILVTGASGFIGNYVITELLKRQQKVIATST
jgi:dTDP-6-deoxy-L-talose 4-dehydrogenase (NAD+)